MKQINKSLKEARASMATWEIRYNSDYNLQCCLRIWLSRQCSLCNYIITKVIWSPEGKPKNISFLSHGPLSRAAHNMAAYFPQVRNPSESKWKMTPPRPKPWSFFNLILEVTSYYFYRILFVRSKSLNPVHIQGEGIAQVTIAWSRDHWKSSLALPNLYTLIKRPMLL